MFQFQEDGSVSFAFSESVASDSTPMKTVYPGVYNVPPTLGNVRQLQVGLNF